MPAPPIICYSHLRWDSVFQRPHQLMTRLAQRRPVLWVEEPIPIEGDQPRLELRTVAPGLRVATPFLRTHWGFFSGDGAEVLTGLLAERMAEDGLHDSIFWLYTPMALHVARPLPARALIYDCMDELSRFRFAPGEIAELEDELLRRADLVFTGGPSLYAAKRDRNPHVHCFPSSVDAQHFAAARGGDLAVEPSTAALPTPRLGYYGVIDERLDLGLIEALAAARPDWQVIMVGPVAKIDPASLPRRPNLHWLGPAAYAALPAHLAGWQVALMPFARNEATEFISPTKTLEYMAAGVPIVSTPLADVAGPYAGVVAIAGSAAEFVAACDQALGAGEAAAGARLAAYDQILAGTSWDRTAAAMEALMAPLTRRRSPARVPTGPLPTAGRSEQAGTGAIVGERR